MDMYLVTFIDAGNCEIFAMYTTSPSFLAALEEANNLFFDCGYPVEDVAKITVEDIDK